MHLHLRANKNSDHILKIPHRQRNKTSAYSKIFLSRNLHPFIGHCRHNRFPHATPSRIQKRKNNILFGFHSNSKRRTLF